MSYKTSNTKSQYTHFGSPLPSLGGVSADWPGNAVSPIAAALARAFDIPLYSLTNDKQKL